MENKFKWTLEKKQETKEEVQQKIEEKVPEEDCYNVPSYSGSPIATTLLDSPMNNAILEKKTQLSENDTVLDTFPSPYCS